MRLQNKMLVSLLGVALVGCNDAASNNPNDSALSHGDATVVVERPLREELQLQKELVLAGLRGDWNATTEVFSASVREFLRSVDLDHPLEIESTNKRYVLKEMSMLPLERMQTDILLNKLDPLDNESKCWSVLLRGDVNVIVVIDDADKRIAAMWIDFEDRRAVFDIDENGNEVPRDDAGKESGRTETHPDQNPEVSGDDPCPINPNK